MAYHSYTGCFLSHNWWCWNDKARRPPCRWLQSEPLTVCRGVDIRIENQIIFMTKRECERETDRRKSDKVGVRENRRRCNEREREKCYINDREKLLTTSLSVVMPPHFIWKKIQRWPLLFKTHRNLLCRQRLWFDLACVDETSLLKEWKHKKERRVVIVNALQWGPRALGELSAAHVCVCACVRELYCNARVSPADLNAFRRLPLSNLEKKQGIWDTHRGEHCGL